LPVSSSSTIFAPGWSFDPFITDYLSLATLTYDTDSGNVSFFAINKGTPI